MPDEHVRRHTIAKPGGGERTLVRLGPRLAASYERAVADHLPRIEGGLHGGVLSNRARRRGSGLELEDWRAARRRYRRAIATVSAGPGGASFVGDVRDCYGSIAPAVVVAAIRGLASPVGTRRLVEVLSELEAACGQGGLPVGPPPSAVLANAVLASVDRTVRLATGVAPIRWVDDVVVPVADPRTAHLAARAFEDALDSIGLEPAPAKCRVVPTEELVGVFGRASLAGPAGRGMMRAP